MHDITIIRRQNQDEIRKHETEQATPPRTRREVRLLAQLDNARKANKVLIEAVNSLRGANEQMTAVKMANDTLTHTVERLREQLAEEKETLIAQVKKLEEELGRG